MEKQKKFVTNILKKLNQYTTKKNILIFTILITILLLIPILRLSFYTFPSADDFSFGVGTMNESNVGTILKGAVDQIKLNYQIWQGTYAAIFIFSLNPAILGENFYFLTTFIILIGFFFGLYYFSKQLLQKVMKLDKTTFWIVLLLFFMLSVETILDRTQGLYWWNGASYYIIFFSLELIEIGLLIKRYIVEEKNKKDYAILCVLMMIIGGGNYVTALQQIILLVFLNAYLILKKKDTSALPLLVLATLGLGISAAAPGNRVRQDLVEKMGAPRAIYESFLAAGRSINDWIHWIQIVTILIIECLLYKTHENIKRIKFPIVIIFLLFCIYAAEFTPSLYAQSNIGEGRLLNIIYFSELLLITISIYVVIHFLRGELQENKILSKTTMPKLESWVKERSFILFALTIIILFTSVYYNRNNLTSFNIYYLLKTEEPSIYRKEWKNRYKVLKDESITKVEFESLTYTPSPIFYSDFSEDPKSWLNEYAIKIYKKEYIITKPKENEGEKNES